MPVYEYRCGQCGAGESVYSSIADYDPEAKPVCVECRVEMGRSYEPFPFRPAMPDHFNNALGRYVTGKKDFVDGLKQASDEATARNGIPHNYVMVDGRDNEAVGVTDGEGLESTMRSLHHQGKKLPKLPSDLR